MLGMACGVLLLVLAVNILVDPNWFFEINNALNTRKCAFDERVQKTNRLLHSRRDYDALLLGSSRSAFIVSGQFSGLKLYNYSLSSVYPEEYEDLVEAAMLRHPVRTVFIGLDFFGTARNRFSFAVQRPLPEYVEGAVKPMRVLGALLSADSLRHALLDMRMSLGGVSLPGAYDQNYERVVSPGDSPPSDETIYRQLLLFHTQCYGEAYRWNGDLPEILRRLRERWPEVRFVVFTTPVSAPMFSLLVHDGRLPDYERLIRLAVQVFGTVHDFMGLNSITRDLANYSDAHHFQPHVGAMIGARITGSAGGAPADFGVEVGPGNLEEHLADLRRQAGHADPDPLARYRALAGAGAEAPRDEAAVAR